VGHVSSLPFCAIWIRVMASYFLWFSRLNPLPRLRTEGSGFIASPPFQFSFIPPMRTLRRKSLFMCFFAFFSFSIFRSATFWKSKIPFHLCPFTSALMRLVRSSMPFHVKTICCKLTSIVSFPRVISERHPDPPLVCHRAVPS